MTFELIEPVSVVVVVVSEDFEVPEVVVDSQQLLKTMTTAVVVLVPMVVAVDYLSNRLDTIGRQSSG